jgi:hypothetical protein
MKATISIFTISIGVAISQTTPQERINLSADSMYATIVKRDLRNESRLSFEHGIAAIREEIRGIDELLFKSCGRTVAVCQKVSSSILVEGASDATSPSLLVIAFKVQSRRCPLYIER